MLTLMRCPPPHPHPHHHPTPGVTAEVRKDPGHSAKSAGSRLHLNTHTLLAQRSRSGLTTSLSRHSVGPYLETSLRAICQTTFGHNRQSSLSHYLQAIPAPKMSKHRRDNFSTGFYTWNALPPTIRLSPLRRSSDV